MTLGSAGWTAGATSVRLAVAKATSEAARNSQEGRTRWNSRLTVPLRRSSTVVSASDLPHIPRVQTSCDAFVSGAFDDGAAVGEDS
jgi:hypothetical protein